MNKIISSKITALTFGILTIAFLTAFYVVAWQEPSQAPPGGNVAAPLNVGNIGQFKEGGLILNTGGAETGLIVEKGESLFNSLTIIGGSSLPTCSSSYRGKMFLLQSGTGTEDGLYVCKKKADDTYQWIALASPPNWVSVDFGDCKEACKVSWREGGHAECCCVVGKTCYGGAHTEVRINADGSRNLFGTAQIWRRGGAGAGGTAYCCGVYAGHDQVWYGAQYAGQVVIVW